MHLIADTRYEDPGGLRGDAGLAVGGEAAGGDDGGLGEETPELGKRCRDFSADRGLDSGPLKERLWEDYGIRPLIEPRELWKEEKKEGGYDPGKAITRPLYPDRADTIVHT